MSHKGYNHIFTELSGAAASSGSVMDFRIVGPLTGLVYVPNNTGNNFYWGRRGSSATLWINTNGANNINYFYSEIYVPVDYDPVGSYYMANGFG